MGQIESVSVIIPAYRAAGTIRRAVESALNQTHAPEEVLVIDDGSPENLAAALSPYAARVRLIRQANGGAASARNAGIELARGSLLAFLDADDYWEADKLERQVAVIRRHPELGLVAARYYEQSPGGGQHVAKRFGRTVFDEVICPKGSAAMAVAAAVWTSTVLVRREALGNERFEPGLEPAEDRDLWVRIVAAHPVCILAEALATAVLTRGSLSRSNIDVDCRAMLRVVRRHAGLLGRGGCRRWEARVFRRWAAVQLAQDQPRAALAAACQRLRRQPASAQAWWIVCKSLVLSAGRSACALGSRRRMLPTGPKPEMVEVDG